MLVRDYQICLNCVMDTSDPKITFDSNGVCDHCHSFWDNVAPTWDGKNGDKVALAAMSEKIRESGKGRDFDAILGISGGLDSSYLLHLAVTEMNLRPLIFHVDGGWDSQIAVQNIERMMDKLDLDLYTEVINWEEMKDFQLAFFKSGVPHIDLPQDHAFIAALYNFALKHKVPYILNGGNISTECVRNPLDYFYYGTDMIQIGDIRRKFTTRKMETYPTSNIFRHKIYLRYIRGIQVAKPLDLMPYTRDDAIQLLGREYDWEWYGQKHFESRFTKFYESYWLPQRFGFDTRRVQLSSLILTGQRNRIQALEILASPAHDPETIELDFEYIANKLDVSVDELQSYFELPLKFYTDYRSMSGVFSLGASVMHKMGLEKSVKR